MATPIPPPDLPTLLTPLLPALPPAAVSTEPADGVLPYLSPILRQRVKILSSSSTEPWLRLLCYDPSKAPRLAEAVAAAGGLEPHPVSGEVEMDWDYDAETRFRRVDSETLQALVAPAEMGIAFQLVWCVNDAEGGGDGWRVGEVTVTEKPSPFSQFGGVGSIAEAERQFKEKQTAGGGAVSSAAPAVTATNGGGNSMALDDDDEDDGYWDRYDATPARTPAATRSPAPPSAANGGTAPAVSASGGADADDDDYFAQYDDVQPAMDNHDPDEAAQQSHLDPPLGLGNSTAESTAQPQPDRSLHEHRGSWVAVSEDAGLPAAAVSSTNGNGHGLAHPRPESSASSTGSHTVAKLEASAGMQEQTEFGVKQHVSRSIRSLFQLSRSMGMGRAEFEQLVRTELDLLGMVEEDV